ncbi:MAG: hypothetical protein ACLVJ6_13605 [Merdibacter sp.]
MSFGISATMAATLSMIISLFNSLSRVFYGIIYDKIGRRTAMGIATTLFLTAVTILYCTFTLGSTTLLAVSFIFVGLSFGAVPTISSAYILTTFGKILPEQFQRQEPMPCSARFRRCCSALFTATQSYPASYSYLIVYALLAAVLTAQPAAEAGVKTIYQSRHENEVLRILSSVAQALKKMKSL